MGLRILEIRTAANEEKEVDLQPGCLVRAIKVSSVVDLGVGGAVFTLQDKAMTVLSGEPPVEWSGLRDPLPAFCRIKNGILRILWEDGVHPK